MRQVTHYIKDFPKGNWGDVFPERGFGNTGGNRGLPNAHLGRMRVVHPL